MQLAMMGNRAASRLVMVSGASAEFWEEHEQDDGLSRTGSEPDQNPAAAGLESVSTVRTRT